ncbi:MAG: hypothetical protein QNJ49_07615 [Mastigocoleus sp. MO_167.B18]|nr:hypothetical protein [Mastigocoleus sp. MO_167.B18]
MSLLSLGVRSQESGVRIQESEFRSQESGVRIAGMEYSLHLLSRVLGVPHLLLIGNMSAYMRFSIDLRNQSNINPNQH